ncbi:hypothetical protein BJ165DRAFT_1612767 [Panaeolus papilionaceus]|nr:hypothetical protein BJ165DRAFT_1612767 [Panaeolus papilionaceus]
MIQSLLDNKAFHRFNIVTTMWDRLGNPQAKKRAETKFAQLPDDIWKGAISEGAQISRFHNDFDSAILILQSIINIEGYAWEPLRYNPIESEDASAPLLYQELLDRISNAQQEKEYLQQEKMRLITNPDPRLELVVLSRLPEVKNNLAKFLRQLVGFGRPPRGFKGVPERGVYQDLLDQVNEAREEQAALTHALVHLHTNPDGDLAQHVAMLLERSTPLEGCKKASENALGPTIIPQEAPPLWSPPSSSDPIPNLPNHAATSEIASTNPIPSHVTSTHPENDVGTPATVEPHPSSIVPDRVSTTATPGCDDITIRHPVSATPEGSVSSRVSLKDHLKKGFRSLEDKLTFRSRCDGHR